MDLQLTGQTALVTGGGSGIGRAIAVGFVAEGARVALWDVADDVEQTACELSGSHDSPACVGLRVDVADRAGVAEALTATVAQLGPIEHLVHAAAVGSGKVGFPFTNLDPDDWRRVIEVNLMGMVHVAHAVAPPMVERKRGTMLFLGSVAGQIGSQTDPPYSAAKAANINFAQCLARDLAPSGVRVNTLCPGMVQTPLNRAVWQAWNDRQPLDKQQSYDEWAAEKIARLVPLGRWQQPEDVAHAAVFLASPRASQITGQTINVDGGYVMHW